MRPRHPLLVLLALAMTLAACQGADVAAPTSYAAPAFVPPSTDTAVPSGRVVVAYPEEPDQWYPDRRAEPAAVDLAHLWGLPLYRIDAGGQLRPALAERARHVPSDEGWTIEIELHEGTWSDGQPVTSADVVATLDALLDDASRADELGGLTGSRAVDEHTVRLSFDQPAGRWPYLLAGAWSVLPAHVLAGDAAQDVFVGPPGVSAGPFEIVDYEAGRRLLLEAHTGSPSGAPRLEQLEIAFVPDFETALGLLEDGRVDLLLGYLALNPVERAEQVEGVRAAAPLGGTSASLVWDADGALSGAGRTDARVAVRASVDVAPQVEGLLAPQGSLARSLLPGSDGPWGIDEPARSLDGIDPTLRIPRWQEVPAFTARALQRDLATFGGGAELLRLEPDVLVRSGQGDGGLVIRRDGPWPSLHARTVDADTEQVRSAARAADRSLSRRSDEVDRALQLLFDQGHVLPLYEIGVVHAWRENISGIEPSAWPGLAFWGVDRWAVASP